MKYYLTAEMLDEPVPYDTKEEAEAAIRKLADKLPTYAQRRNWWEEKDGRFGLTVEWIQYDEPDGSARECAEFFGVVLLNEGDVA